MNILVIAPHPDDESIGCGGTLCLHADAGDRVAVVFLTSGELGLKHLPREEAWKVREREARRAAKIIGIAELSFLHLPDWMVSDHFVEGSDALRPILQRESPGLIYLPHPADAHPDHQASWPLLKQALNDSETPRPKLRTYEVWTPMSNTEEVQDITSVMPRKLKAIRAHRSQLADFQYDKAMRGLNQYRGEISGRCQFAEVFGTISI